MFDLAGKGIAITGGGGHLGAPIARAAAEVGATVVICGRDEATLDEAARHSERIVPIAADASTDEGIGIVLDRLEDAAGSIDGWVNNAYSGVAGNTLDASRARLAETVQSGLVDLMAATQLVAARMSSGAIVNVASMYGLVSPRPDLYAAHSKYHNPPAYGAAKAGVVQFTRYAAVHLADRAIRVNCVSPGAFPKSTAPREFVARLEEQIPLGRIGRPSELVGAFLFLLSDASSYVTGHNLVVDGGWTAW